MTNTIYIHQPEKAFSFTRLPNFLFEAPTFKPLSNEAKVLYAFILRRTELSFKNKRRVRKPQSEWVWVENTQEPIISEQVFPAGTGADSKPPQEVQGWYNADFFRIGKMCGLRLVAVLWGEQAEQQALRPLSL